MIDLPANRVLVFNPRKNPFDIAKINYYRMKNEKAIEISFDMGEFSGTKIRDNLRKGIRDLGFLPKSCHEYFISHCLEYFQSDSQQGGKK